MAKQVALCLASGGSRGMAHIGAIEELLARGYEITSISGCSIGSLIGGIYAAGKIEEAHRWFCSLDKQQVFSLTDFSFGLSHMVKGSRVMNAIQEWVPNCLIEDLPIPCAFVATDIVNSREVVFRTGKLFDAIRASISIPLCFEPVPHEDGLLVDGGLTNPFPLNRVERTPGDILIGINISGTAPLETNEIEMPNIPEKWVQSNRAMQRVNDLWERVSSEIETHDRLPHLNYASMLNRTIDVQIQANCRLMTEACKPNVLVEMPQNAYTTFDFDKAEEIIAQGRQLMAKALDQYENK